MIFSEEEKEYLKWYEENYGKLNDTQKEYIINTNRSLDKTEIKKDMKILSEYFSKNNHH